MRCLIYLYLCLLPLVGFTQNYAEKEYYLIDSLDLEDLNENDKELIEKSLKIYHNTNTDTGKINALAVICNNMMHEDWGRYQFFQLHLINKSIESSPKPKKLKVLKGYLANAHNNIGFIYQNQGKVKLALEQFSKSLKIKEEIKDNYGIAYALNNLGFILQEQGQIQEALDHYERSLKIREEIDDKNGVAYSLNNIGHIYQQFGKIDLALDFFSRSLKIREEIGDKFGIAHSLNNIGAINRNIGKEQEAIVYFLRSLEIREELGDRPGIAQSLDNIASVYKKIGRLGDANMYLLKSLKIAQKIGYPQHIKNASQDLSENYEEQGDFFKALEMYKLHIKMRDSLNNEATQKAAIQQQAKYEYEKQKAIDDAEHEKEIAIEQEAKEKQTILTYATGGGLGLVGIFLLIVFNRLKVTRKQKNIIEEQKQEVEHQKEVVEKAHTQLEEKNKEITDSIQYAKRIQNAILPSNKVVKEYLTESFILYKPKDIVAGDFYWLEQKDNKVLFAAADCTGHGVPGAMVSVVCNNGLNRSVREYGLTSPGEILNKTREIVVQEFEKSEEEVKDGMDIALCSLEGNKLQYAGAHNPLWIIRKDSNEIEEIKANKQPIGKFDNPEPYTTHTIGLQKGDSIYIFSDGYADQFGGEKGKKLKTANFKKLLLTIQNENIQRQKELIDEAFEEWKGNLEQLDDVCVIGVRL